MFYKKLKIAPMIYQCDINGMLTQRTFDFPKHDIFVGKIINAFFDKTVLNDGEAIF